MGINSNGTVLFLRKHNTIEEKYRRHNLEVSKMGKYKIGDSKVELKTQLLDSVDNNNTSGKTIGSLK